MQIVSLRYNSHVSKPIFLEKENIFQNVICWNFYPSCSALMFKKAKAFAICIYMSANKLTLKTPRKPASENVVCLCRLLNILANFFNLFLYTGKQCGPRSKEQSNLGPHCLQK